MPSLVQHRPQQGTGILHQQQGALVLFKENSGDEVMAGLVGCGKTMLARRKSNGSPVWDNRTRRRRIAERDWRDGRDEGESNLFTLCLSPMSRASRATVWALADFFSILLDWGDTRPVGGKRN